ncbi:MAG: TIGR04282 family arsenosugar biosynthesis glycosyltransferase [Acidobacteria bacterium]|nr:TIGR04282 family arsenosugar biosynthesis glycosyltransferase [Acidobacteriota bacterium]
MTDRVGAANAAGGPLLRPGGRSLTGAPCSDFFTALVTPAVKRVEKGKSPVGNCEGIGAATASAAEDFSSQNPRRPAIALFARTPVPGRVKTRLQTVLTAEQALALHVACMEDLCEQLAPLAGTFEIFLFQSEPGALPERCRRYPARLQAGAGLGERMERAAESLLKAGHPAVIFLGTDLPHLDPARLAETLCALQRCQVVIGPTRDGGYYLLALKRLYRELFCDIEWGSSSVLAETLRRLQRVDVAFEMLPVDFDLDVPEDLKRFLQAPGRIRAPRTLELLLRFGI